MNRNIFTKIDENKIDSESNLPPIVDKDMFLDKQEGGHSKLSSVSKYSLSTNCNKLQSKLFNINNLMSDSDFLGISTTKENLFGKKIMTGGGNVFSATTYSESQIQNKLLLGETTDIYSDTSYFEPPNSDSTTTSNTYSYSTSATRSSFNVPKNNDTFTGSGYSSSSESSSSSSSSSSSISSTSTSVKKPKKNNKK